MTDERDTGIPTRAIHESYLQLQQAHQEFRRARDSGEDSQELKGAFQDAILTFHELIRPHLKHESALADYWTGNIPDYTGWDFDSQAEAARYVREKGTGVYQVQQHVNQVQLDDQMLTDGGEPTGWTEWHNALGLSWESERLVSIQPAQDRHFVRVLRVAVLPLRELDGWRARVVRERKRGGGFLAGESSVHTRHEYQSTEKMVTAKRLLVEAADRLGVLSEIDASTQRTEITREDLEKVEEWRQKQLNE